MGGMSFDPPITLAKTVYRLNEALMPAQLSEREKFEFLASLDAQQHLDEAAQQAAAAPHHAAELEQAQDRGLAPPAEGMEEDDDAA